MSLNHTQALTLLIENYENVCRLKEGQVEAQRSVGAICGLLAKEGTKESRERATLYLSLEKVLQKLTTKLEKKEKKIHKLKKEIQSWKSWAEEEEEEEEEDWDEEVETYLMEDGTEIWVENDDVFNWKTGDWMGNTDDLKVRI